MEPVISKDGSRIAYDRYGAGPTVILVGGALSYRKFSKMEELGAAARRALHGDQLRPPRARRLDRKSRTRSSARSRTCRR